jgi:hypothetical protein
MPIGVRAAVQLNTTLSGVLRQQAPARSACLSRRRTPDRVLSVTTFERARVRYRLFQLPIWQAQTIRQPLHFLPSPRSIAANNEPLGGLPPGVESAVLSLADVHCTAKFGGLRKQYTCRAA